MSATTQAAPPSKKDSKKDQLQAEGVKKNKSSLEAVAEFIGDLSSTLSDAIAKIDDVNSNTHLLALNARIEAARAGSAGLAFGVVAQEMQSLSAKTAQIADHMASQTKSSISSLLDEIDTSVRGSRLADMALTNIDLIDRNLYERTCDVRWWATDSSLVDALTQKTPEAYQYASQRMGVILGAYTVYHDLVLCDLSGHVVANGKPGTFSSTGADVHEQPWYREAAKTSDGDQYGFQGAHRSSLVDGRSVLAYSCGVRSGGQSNGKLLGVLGILFKWEEFAQTIMDQTPLTGSEKQRIRCCICEPDGRIIADSEGRQLDDVLSLPEQEKVFVEKKNYLTTMLGAKKHCVGHAQAPGFETYSTGWHSVLLERSEG